MEYVIDKNNILLIIPATNAGKFRFKKRRNRLDFGETFSTRECPFDDQTYLEWQIGYDVPIKDVEKKTITVEHHSQLTINGINFEETSIKLPTLFMIETLDDTQIEVSIQKQQYASGVQPMVYFCIPLRAFKNSPSLLGKSSVSGDKLAYVLSKSNVLNLIFMMKVFGMASKRHNHDVVEILKILLEIIDR